MKEKNLEKMLPPGAKKLILLGTVVLAALTGCGESPDYSSTQANQNNNQKSEQVGPDSIKMVTDLNSEEYLQKEYENSRYGGDGNKSLEEMQANREEVLSGGKGD